MLTIEDEMRENVSSGGGESDSLSRPGASGQREKTECECEVGRHLHVVASTLASSRFTGRVVDAGN